MLIFNIFYGHYGIAILLDFCIGRNFVNVDFIPKKLVIQN